MKKRVLSILLALVLTLSLAPAAMAASPESSRNVNAQNYGRWASTVWSYLLENAQGGVTRVEYVTAYSGDRIIVEDYDRSFHLTGSHAIPVELDRWGGFFAGEDYNFFIFGQENKSQDDSAEVIRVVKYSKDWQRLDQASLCGANTTVPFDAGSLRCDEAGGYLYIRTCHEMYASKDGKNHQANLTMCVRQKDMTITDSAYKVANVGVGYVSHSFNQFILVDSQNRIVAVDHGDAYPRSIVLTRCNTPAGRGSFSGKAQNIDILKFPGAIGDNTTGATVGGFEETSNGYVVAFNHVVGSDGKRDMYLAFVDKNLSGVSITRLTTGASTKTPQLVSTGPDGGYILWTDSDTDALFYAAYDANGKPGTVKTAAAALSDCKPIVHDGNAVWYVTSSSEPVFYILNDAGVQTVTDAYVPENTGRNDGKDETRTDNQSRFKDLAENAYYLDAVQWAVDRGIVAGLTDTEFGPEVTCTQAQIVTFLWRAAGQPTPKNTASLNAAETGKYYSNAVAWAKELGMLDAGFSAEAPCTRAMTVTWLWKQAGAPASGTAGFTDVPHGAAYAPAVAWATANGITSGTTDTTFSPNDTCTRAQVVSFLYRAKTL